MIVGHWMVDNSHYKTSLHAAREIFHTEGIRGFYSGYCSCILTDCVNSGFQVLFTKPSVLVSSSTTRRNEKGTCELERHGGVRFSWERRLGWQSLSCSFHDNLQSIRFDHVQTDGAGSQRVWMRFWMNIRAKYYHGIGDVIKKVYRNEGIFGFYKGLLPRMMYVTPLVAIQYSGYQLIRKSIGLTQSM